MRVRKWARSICSRLCSLGTLRWASPTCSLALLATSSTTTPRPQLGWSSRPRLWKSMVKRLRHRSGTLLAKSVSGLSLLLTIGGAVGALLVYDISRRTAFDSINRWLQELSTHCDTTVARMLVGNKCDLENIREVSIEEGKSLAEAEGLFFLETSALDSTKCPNSL